MLTRQLAATGTVQGVDGHLDGGVGAALIRGAGVIGVHSCCQGVDGGQERGGAGVGSSIQIPLIPAALGLRTTRRSAMPRS